MASADGNGHRELNAPPIPLAPSRAPTTTIDDIEKEFQKKKQKELEHARMAGGGDGTGVQQRRVGEKVGRNDPCPCGSGKKYKRCHGAEG